MENILLPATAPERQFQLRIVLPAIGDKRTGAGMEFGGDAKFSFAYADSDQTVKNIFFLGQGKEQSWCLFAFALGMGSAVTMFDLAICGRSAILILNFFHVFCARSHRASAAI